MTCSAKDAWGVCTYIWTLAILILVGSSIHARADATTFEQRRDYQEAIEKLRLGQITQFRKIATRLDNYILRPYLDYRELRRRLSTASTKEVMTFTSANADLPATERLHSRWLKELGKRREWRTLREQYRSSNDAELQCYYLRALYGTDAKVQALDETTALWLQPVSQPKACDPLFEVWRGTERFNEDIVWQRFEAAIMANERSLASYLIRYLTGSNQTVADAYYKFHVSPTRVAKTSQYKQDSAKYRTAIAHGISRLARRDAKKAQQAWQRYQRSHSFDELTAQRINGVLATRLAKDNIFPNVGSRNAISSPDVLENIANEAVEQQNWSEARYWIERLPNDVRMKSQWQYWLARSLAQLNDPTGQVDTIYAALAQQRHYYGFLAARQLGLPGQMNAASIQTNNIEQARIKRIPGVRRSIELFAVGDNINGRREWYNVLNEMSVEQQIIAAEVAQQLGLISMGISTANIADASNHLHLRFPLAYEAQFRRASLKTGLETPFLISIARQESAMEASARSSANARGLMQLLPSTAKIVARRAKLSSPSAEDLNDPSTNIALGSFHLAWLMVRYDSQSPLAIAAYNAGEHRVDRWIKDSFGMPMDVWIERIPFRETRNYVKNVLAFRQVYGEKLNEPTPVLKPNENTLKAS